MSQAERYLQRADEVERIAKESLIPAYRSRLVEIADELRRLAAQLERIEARRWPPENPFDA